MELYALVNYMDDYLRVSEISDVSINGLQIEGKKDVKKLCLGVDSSLEIFKETSKRKADLLLVHHGLIWGGLKSIRGLVKERISYLLEKDISLYAAHLPLDMHPEVGNNIGLIKILNLLDPEPFGAYHGIKIGFKGKYEKMKSVKEISKTLEKSLPAKVESFNFGPDKIKSVGIVSGCGGSAFEDCIKEEIDLFITGEPSHTIYHIAKEAGINLIFAGHYATEKLGVMALGKNIEEKFKIKTEFIDIPTGL
ncbi:MAG: metal-binding protein [Candidatus Methanofastidiosum methylothiophilum]|uniref:Metal-binding protein n=1 Tax=Candidatus Methanofastidiosum methylothiophilum TaxID=1705564 RepID=A0A150IQJ0_9EURY|nr:MAG: metal-binding protein [Candidatus Methanofastidiosum methylthiophilus]KYC47220.1 MAG: metal-binding protein [Candidatus Methanofastidiosum methylthiophilus]KYC49154.1 MAG: metal-binding protein [Candidatus Methanofastidiosum methylthiophilus]